MMMGESGKLGLGNDGGASGKLVCLMMVGHQVGLGNDGWALGKLGTNDGGALGKFVDKNIHTH